MKEKKNLRRTLDEDLAAEVEEIFLHNRCVYGARKIKAILGKRNKQISRRRIIRIMKAKGLDSVYQRRKYKAYKTRTNEHEISNLLNRDFNDKKPHTVIVGDLTYVGVRNKWHYICLLVDLHNREIIGSSCGERKDSALVKSAFRSIKTNLFKIGMFHTDRGSEFDNYDISEILDTFKITRSLSHKGCPYDNAVSEATFKLIKAEFVYRNTFDSIEHLKRELDDYINWYNNARVHSKLGYMTPTEYREASLTFL